METDLSYSLIKMISALSLVLGVMLLLFFLARKTVLRGQGFTGGAKVIKILAQQAIGPKKSVAVVSVAGEYLVLGISADQITMLSKIESSEALDRISDSQIEIGRASFQSILGNFINPTNRGERK